MQLHNKVQIRPLVRTVFFSFEFKCIRAEVSKSSGANQLWVINYKQRKALFLSWLSAVYQLKKTEQQKNSPAQHKKKLFFVSTTKTIGAEQRWTLFILLKAAMSSASLLTKNNNF